MSACHVERLTVFGLKMTWAVDAAKVRFRAVSLFKPVGGNGYYSLPFRSSVALHISANHFGMEDSVLSSLLCRVPRRLVDLRSCCSFPINLSSALSTRNQTGRITQHPSTDH